MKMNYLDYLSLVFIGLKLANYINWSWWWVLSPMIISLVVKSIIRTYLERETWMK